MVEIHEFKGKEGEEEELVNLYLPVQPTETRNLLMNFAGEQEKEQTNIDLELHLASKPHPDEQEREQTNLDLELHLASKPRPDEQPTSISSRKRPFSDMGHHSGHFLGLSLAFKPDEDQARISSRKSSLASISPHLCSSQRAGQLFPEVAGSPANQTGDSLDLSSSLIDQRVHRSKPVDDDSSSIRKPFGFTVPDMQHLAAIANSTNGAPRRICPRPSYGSTDPYDLDGLNGLKYPFQIFFIGKGNQHQPLLLPVGYRFRPTEKQLIAAYLNIKIQDPTVDFSFIPVSKELYLKHPKSILESSPERSCYFFIELKRAKLNASRTVKDIGVWQNDGNDKQVSDKSGGIGRKVNLCFHSKEGTKLKRTKFLMKEFVSNQSSTAISMS